MQIEREILIEASLQSVLEFCQECPYSAALSFKPEGANTRIRLKAEVWPEDLAAYIEELLLTSMCQVRDHFSQHGRFDTPVKHQNHNQRNRDV